MTDERTVTITMGVDEVLASNWIMERLDIPDRAELFRRALRVLHAVAGGAIVIPKEGPGWEAAVERALDAFWDEPADSAGWKGGIRAMEAAVRAAGRSE